MSLSKWTVAGLYCGLGFLICGFTPVAQAQDRAPGTNDDTIRKPRTPEAAPKPDPKPKKNGKNGKMAVEMRRVLIFPPDLPSPAGISDQLTDDIVRVIQRRLEATDAYYSTYFLRSLPTVKRAVNDGTLTANDTDRPFDNVKIKRLSQIAGYSLVFSTTISEYKYDADKHQVTLSLSLNLFEYSGSKVIVRSAAEDMTGPADANKSEVDLALVTARDLTEKLMTELFKTRTIPKDTKEPDTSKSPEKNPGDVTEDPHVPDNKPDDPKTPPQN